MNNKRHLFWLKKSHNYLEITERLYTFSWIKFDNFDQVLNNFYASYFAGALLIPRKQLVSELNLFLIKTDPKPQEMIELMGKFNVSGIIYQRLTNILPKDFQLKNIFFFDCLIKRSRYLSDKKRAAYY
jgi:hypothetical protein